MNKHYFIELLHKYLDGKATMEEKRFLASYYDLFENEADVTNLLSAGRKEELKTELQNAIWDHISRQEESAKPQKSPNRITTLKTGPLQSMPLQAVPMQTGTPQTGTPQTGAPQTGTIRTLPIDTPSIGIRKTASVAAAVLLVLGATWLYLGHKTSERKQPEAPAESIVSMVNQKKENHLVSLPDGSTVVLGFGSKLDYPSSFDDQGKREVYLEGQAFFDIRHNTAKPFIVHTGKLATTVLGTSFNIKAFSEEQEITVTVKTGEVKVSDEHRTLAIVRPAQQIIYNKQKANSTRQAVASESYLDWKGQDLLFDNLTVEEAARQLEERFNVKISVSDPSIGVKRFTTTFSKKENLEEALESICVFNGAVFHYDKTKASVVIGKL